MKFYNQLKRYAGYALPVGVTCAASFPVWATDASTTVTSTDWAPIIEAMTGQISVSTVVGVVATAISAGIGLVFMWWGGRKAVRTLMSAFRKGKVSM